MENIKIMEGPEVPPGTLRLMPANWSEHVRHVGAAPPAVWLSSEADWNALISPASVRAIAVETRSEVAPLPALQQGANLRRDMRSTRPWLAVLVVWLAHGNDDPGWFVTGAIRLDTTEGPSLLELALSCPAPLITHEAKRLLFAAWSLKTSPTFERLYDTQVVAECLEMGKHHSRGDARDTMARRATKDARFSLAGLCLAFDLPVPPETPYRREDDHSPRGTRGMRAQTLAARTEQVLRVALAQQCRVVEAGLGLHLRAIELPYTVTNARIEWHGVALSVPALDLVRSRAPEALATLREALGSSGVAHPHDDRALAAWLAAAGIPLPPEANGTAIPDRVLKALAGRHPAISAFRSLRRLSTLLRAPWFNSDLRGADGRIHPRHLQLGAATGRSSCLFPNLTALPRWARAMIVPAPGHIFFMADYAQCEIGVAAALHQDPVLIELYNSGEDLYARLAQRTFRSLSPLERTMPSKDFKTTRPEMRAWMKQIVLAALYGAGPRALGARLGVSEAEAQELRDSFLQAFPTLRAGLEATAIAALEQGYIEIVSGLRRYASADGEPSWKTRNWGLNTPVQGAAAAIFKLALTAIDRRFLGTGARIVLPLHDGLLVECPSSMLDRAVSIVEACMSEAMRSVFPGLLPRLEVDTSSPASWGSPEALRAFLADPTHGDHLRLGQIPQHHDNPLGSPPRQGVSND